MKFSLVVLGLLVVGSAHWPHWHHSQLSGRLAAQVPEDSTLAGRHRMVEDQIKARGIKDTGVLAAMLKVPRERFVELNPVVGESLYVRPKEMKIFAPVSRPWIQSRMKPKKMIIRMKPNRTTMAPTIIAGVLVYQGPSFPGAAFGNWARMLASMGNLSGSRWRLSSSTQPPAALS